MKSFSPLTAQGSFRRRIILTFVVGFFLLATAFTAYQFRSERAFLYHESNNETVSLAESLAASSRSWVLANDVAGLQEVVRAFQAHPELRYAMVISPAGQVLAHSDAKKVGQYLTDEQSRILIKSAHVSRVMIDDESMSDVVVPIMVDQRFIGWARIGQERVVITDNLRKMMWSSVLFVLVSVVLVLFAALLIANRLGYRIGKLMLVAEKVQAGNYATRANISGVDEIAKLANSLNHMLDVLARDEEQLRKASTYTRSLIEASLDPLVTISPEGKITDVNTATEQATGRSRSELIGTDFSDYFTEPSRAREGYREVFAKGFVADYPLALRHVDGHVTDVLYNASIYRDETGSELGVFAAARDVTARNAAEAALRENEALLQATLKILPAGLWIFDAEGKIVYSNDAAQKIWAGAHHVGINQLVEYKGWRVDNRSRVGPHDWAGARAIEKGETSIEDEVEIECFDGTHKTILDSAVPLRNSDGNIRGAVTINYDITERKRAEEALFEAQQKFRTLVENSPDIITRYDRDCRRTYVNPTYLNVAQISQAELLGSAPVQRSPLPAAGALTLQNLLRKVLDTGIVEAIDVKWPMADNRDHWYNIYAFPEFDREGQVISVMTVSRDITERKQAEVDLRQSEEALKEAQRIAHLGSWYMDIATNQVVWSEVLYEMYGFDPALPPPLYTESMKLFTPDSWEKLSTAIARTTETGVPYELELEMAQKDGHNGWMLALGELVRDELGAPVRVRGVVMDITERKKAERELRELNSDFVTLLESTSDFIYFKDKESRIRFCSQTLADVTGHHSWRDMIGKHDLEVFPEDVARIYYEEELPIFKAGKPLLNKTNPYYDDQGKRGWVNTNKWPVFADDKKTVVGIFGISRDVTELKEAEDEIKALNRNLEQRVDERTEQLEAANKELEAFSYSVSHDLRTPLRAIDGFSHILLEDYAGKLDDEGKRLLKVVRDNTNRMGQLIDDILQFSRTGRLALTFTGIDMERLVHEVVEELKPVFVGGKLQFEIDALPSSTGDRAMMRQVFMNLISNALKFSRHNTSPTVHVGASIEGNETIYYVKDNGVGFDMKYSDKLFGVFQRLHSMEEFEGTGIGLAIVKRIITRHGGRVWADGKINEGATIYFALPITEASHG